MKQILLILCSLVLFACKQQTESNTILQNRIDSLETKLTNTYKPGFGDFMGTIQTHHYKLWLAGQNENWKLADFEIHEIEETLEDILKYQANRKETQLIGILDTALDSIENAIEQKDPVLFKRSYISLTNACNVCHQATDHEFIRVKVPDISTFSNQDFKPIE